MCLGKLMRALKHLTQAALIPRAVGACCTLSGCEICSSLRASCWANRSCKGLWMSLCSVWGEKEERQGGVSLISFWKSYIKDGDIDNLLNVLTLRKNGESRWINHPISTLVCISIFISQKHKLQLFFKLSDLSSQEANFVFNFLWWDSEDAG